MGQEIVHCSVCGLRLRSVDFEKGDALRVDLTAYCRACCPQVIPPHKADPPSQTTRRKTKNSTTRIPVVTPKQGTPSVHEKPVPPVLLWTGAGLVVGLIAATLLLVTNKTRTPEPSVGVAPPPEMAAKPDVSIPAPPPRPAPVLPPAPTEAAELAELDRKTAAFAAQEQFGEAWRILSNAKARHDTLEWTSGIQRRMNDLDNTVKALYLDLQEKLTHARRRGAEDEVKTIAERIARWDMAGYAVPVAKTADPGTPAPAPADKALPSAPTPAPAAEKPTAIPFVAGPMKWTLLTPAKLTATGGAVLTALEDGSVLASGPSPHQSRYAIAVQTDLKGIAAFRLEVLPDRSLPANGPGRPPNGNIVLTEFQVQVIADPNAESGTPVTIAQSIADYAQESFPIANAHDGKQDTGWALGPSLGRAHEAVFETKAPVSAATLLIVLDHQSIYQEHVIGRFRLSATTVKNATSEIASRPPPAIDPARVDQAIQRGIAWLKNPRYPADYAWSANELILWTFVHAGVPETDPTFQARLKQMLESPLDKTYRVALQAMILEELDRVAYQYRIWQCAQFLVDNQCLNGQWLYGTPVELPKGVPTPAKTPVATAAKLDPEGRRIKPKVVRKMVARKTRDGPAEGDNSNSQYAALGLRACFDAGILIPEETIHRAMKWWIESQYFDEKKEGDYAAKGWSYTSAAKEARAAHAMTAGGISSLTIYDYMLGREWKKSVPIRSGLNWLGQFFTINSYYYYLYGMERAAVLYGTDKIGRHAWYPLGAQFILDHQDASGAWVTHSWDKPDEMVWNTWDTCFAILFLKRATRPLVSSEDRR